MASDRPRPGSGGQRIAPQLGLTPEEGALICRLPLFAGLGDEQLGQLLGGAVVRRYERNAVLFIAGEPATRFFVVLDGWIRLFRNTPEGQESTIGLFGPGESFAEAAMLDGASYPVSCTVVARARLLTIQAAPFLAHLRQNPDLALNLLAAMYRHLRRLVQQVEQLTSRSSVQRVADFLLRLCPPGQPRADVELPLDKGLVAARLGMQPETLSRSLARLRDAGVETTGSRIVVADVRRLRQMAEQRRS